VKQTGVYAILNLRDQRVYIGSSVDVRARWNQHRSKLRRGLHCNHELQAAWSVFGSPLFSWVLLEETVDRDSLIDREQFWLDSTPDTYNVSTRAGSGPKAGFRHTPDAIEKMRAAMLGRPKSPEHRARLSLARTGSKQPKHAAALRGRQMLPHVKAALLVANLGRKHSPEERARRAAAISGRACTPETRARISATQRRRLSANPHTATQDVSACGVRS
jgi:group I intron endonuclease